MKFLTTLKIKILFGEYNEMERGAKRMKEKIFFLKTKFFSFFVSEKKRFKKSVFFCYRFLMSIFTLNFCFWLSSLFSYCRSHPIRQTDDTNANKIWFLMVHLCPPPTLLTDQCHLFFQQVNGSSVNFMPKCC